MLTMMLILAGASLIVELMIAHRSKIYRQFVQSGTIQNLIGSFGISYILGWLFGAAGLIVLAAAVLSTVIAIPVYQISKRSIPLPDLRLPEDCINWKGVFA